MGCLAYNIFTFPNELQTDIIKNSIVSGMHQIVNLHEGILIPSIDFG